MATLKIFNHYLRLPFVLLACLELLVFFLSAYTAALLRFNGFDLDEAVVSISYSGSTHSVLHASVFSAVMLTSMIALGQYQSQQHYTPGIFTDIVLRVLLSLVLGSILLMVIYYVFPASYMGRGFHGISLLFSFVGVIFTRALFFQMLGRDVLKRRVLVVGAGSRAKTLINEKGGYQDGTSYKLLGYLPVQNEQLDVPEYKVVNVDPDNIYQYAIEQEVDEIVLAIEDRRKNYPDEELMKCRMGGIQIVDPVTFLEREQGKVNLEMLHPSWIIYSSGFETNLLKTSLSRLFDIVSSLLILIIMSPIMLVTAFLISLESRFRHPVLYKQERVGLNGENFTLMKFRSMSVNAEKDGKAVWASKNDNRITLVGRFIRKTRIDELPQIINILKGDMRLVGPRPERPEFVEELAEKIPYYKKRLAVKPGLAGWAQLKYPYGATERDAYEKLQYDLYYVKNHNVIMDFFILLQTIEIVILGKGAR